MSLTTEQRAVHVLDSAERLFNRQGFQATSMAQLVTEVGLGTASVYRLHASKELLAVAVLNRLSHRELAQLDQVLATCGGQPSRGLAAVIENAWHQVRQSDFCGCLFQRSTIEFPDPTHPVRITVVEHRVGVQDRFTHLTTALVGHGKGPQMADELVALIEGMRATAVPSGPDGPAGAARLLARRLVRDAA